MPVPTMSDSPRGEMARGMWARATRARRHVRRCDVAVIGAGMGGWAGVRAARRRGKSVALFESGPVGGT